MQGYDQAETGEIKEPIGVEYLAEVISELERELSHFYSRITPVLMPEGPEEAVAILEPRGTMSPFGEQVDRVRKLRSRLTEIHQRLDL